MSTGTHVTDDYWPKSAQEDTPPVGDTGPASTAAISVPTDVNELLWSVYAGFADGRLMWAAHDALALEHPILPGVVAAMAVALALCAVCAVRYRRYLVIVDQPEAPPAVARRRARKS